MSQFDLETLVSELKPVKRIKPVDALALVAASTLAATFITTLRFDMRADILSGSPSTLVILRSGMLLLLGLAALAAVIAAARPGIGQASHGWRWALGAALLFPLTSLAVSLTHGTLPMEELNASDGFWCLAISLSGAALVGSGLTHWLRRGAPVAIHRAGWLVGLTAGAFGTLAYNLFCQSNTVHFIGIWYSLAVALSAVAGRTVVPRLIRW